MTGAADETTPPDPLGLWREWLAQSERHWNAALNQAMATEQFGQASGRFLDAYVAMQKHVLDVMGRYLTTLNIPSRGDVLALAERLLAIAHRLVRIESSLDRLAPAAEPTGPIPAPARPPRTRRPGAA